MIKAICFDLDGVYFSENGFKSFKQKIIDMGADTEKVKYYLHGEPMLEFKRGTTKEQEYWQNAVEYLELKISPEKLVNLLPLGYEINQEVHGTVLKVRKNGYKTCICSNNFETRVRLLDEKFDFIKNFDVPIFSYEVGVIKPDKKIFEILVESAEVLPKELIYSDDSEMALQGAKEVGINAFVYEGFDKFKNKLIELGVKLD